MTQEKRILQWLRDNQTIDPIQALSELGIYRLGARIKDLRNQGYRIVTERVANVNRYGEKVQYAKYRLEV